jgi:hypothetical protein
MPHREVYPAVGELARGRGEVLGAFGGTWWPLFTAEVCGILLSTSSHLTSTSATEAGMRQRITSTLIGEGQVTTHL